MRFESLFTTREQSQRLHELGISRAYAHHVWAIFSVYRSSRDKETAMDSAFTLSELISMFYIDALPNSAESKLELELMKLTNLDEKLTPTYSFRLLEWALKHGILDPDKCNEALASD